MLDLMLTNIPSKIQRVTGIADHETVYTEIDMRPVINRQRPRIIPLYRKARWDSMKQAMINLKGEVEDMEESGQDANDLWNRFQHALGKTIDDHVPNKLVKRKDGFRWITREIRNLIKKRDRYYKKKKTSADQKHTTQYKNSKHIIQKKLRQAYWPYTHDILFPKKDNSQEGGTGKRFWTNIKHRKTDNSGISALKGLV